jgi:hypothetical protein
MIPEAGTEEPLMVLTIQAIERVKEARQFGRDRQGIRVACQNVVISVSCYLLQGWHARGDGEVLHEISKLVDHVAFGSPHNIGH